MRNWHPPGDYSELWATSNNILINLGAELRDGMGNLRITDKGLKLEGDSEFLQPLYAKEIQSRPVSTAMRKRNVKVHMMNLPGPTPLHPAIIWYAPHYTSSVYTTDLPAGPCEPHILILDGCIEGNALYFKSARNVTVNILNDQTKVLTQLITGPKAVEAYGKKFEVKTVSGKLLFSADNHEVVVGAERLRVLGAEGTVFPKSIETPNVRADPFKEL
ncbi:hypothetical protein GH733_004948, partial [Mirounga leonina]